MMQATPNTNIVFFGTPEISARVLSALLEAGYHVSAVVTNPDQPVGRKQIMTAPPVKTLAESRDIPVFQPEKLDANFISLVTSNYPLATSLGIVVAYGSILPQTLIDTFPLGLLNIHYSLLPKYRGASPVEQSILAGDATTGVTIQKLVFKLDAGPIVATKEIPINNFVTAPELKEELTDAGIELLLETLPKYLAGEITSTEQDETLATHCGKISKVDGELLPTDSDMEKWRKYRAYFGWPGVFYFDSENKRNKVTLATFENDKFVIKKIIPEGKSEISIA